MTLADLEDARHSPDRELQSACALAERIITCPDDGEFHRRLPKSVRDAFAVVAKTRGVPQEAVDELAAKFARARAEADVRAKLKVTQVKTPAASLISPRDLPESGQRKSAGRTHA